VIEKLTENKGVIGMQLIETKVEKAKSNKKVTVLSRCKTKKNIASDMHSGKSQTRKPAKTKSTVEVVVSAPTFESVDALQALKQRQEEILEIHMPLVRLVAERIHRRLPPGIDLASLINSGIVGLLEAAQRYDSHRGVAFQTYARYRIQGEIIEYLRSLDWVSRSVRSWGRKMAVARTRLAGRLGREASPGEMASELGVELTEYYRVDQKVNEASLVSLEDITSASEEKWRKTQDDFSMRSFQDPFTSVEGKELVEKLAEAIETLSERERLIVTLYYYEELTLREIGEILSLTEGRICQIHAQAVVRLQNTLGVDEGQRRAA
jgi:RNA polymerase sigma factor for flagellar operon FliA